MLHSLAERSLELLAYPLDQVRYKLLKRFGTQVRPFIRSKELRVTTIACIGILSAAWMSLYLPLWQLALGPILWGIPHIIGDLRYLVVHKGLYRSWWFWVCMALPLAHFTYRPYVTTTMLALAGSALVAMYPKLSPTSPKTSKHYIRGIAVIICAAFGYYGAQRYPYHAHFLLLHLHNLITITIWWFWRPRKQLWEWLPIAMMVFFTLLLFLGWGAESWRQVHSDSSAPLSMHYFELSLARLLPENWRPQWVVIYGFLQSLHYLVWIRLIPEDNRSTKGPITFKRSALNLSKDFGPWLILIALSLMLILLLWSTVSLPSARMSYLRWISSHASLEIAVMGYLFVEKARGSISNGDESTRL